MSTAATDSPSARVPGFAVADALERQPDLGRTLRGISRRGAEVAVTVLDEPASRELRATFLAVMRSLRRPPDGRIMQVLTVSGHGAQAYVVTRMPAGPRLDRVLGRGELTPAELIDALGPLPSALDAARAGGLEPRDLAPHNIYLADDGAVLSPFAFLDPRDRPTAAGRALMPYVAPEVVARAPTSPASDVYALAGLVHRGLTGHPPPPPSMRPPRTGSREPAGVPLVVWDALAPVPESRPARPAEFLDEAGRALRRHRLVSRDSAAATVSAPRTLAAVLAIALAGTAGGIAVLLDDGAASATPERTIATAPPAAVGPQAELPGAVLAGAAAARPSSLYADELRTTMIVLNERRRSRRAQLAAARTPRGQARLADGLAAAFDAAADRQARGATPRAVRTANGQIVLALRRVASGYREVASAARAGRPQRFVRARDIVRLREATLQRRIVELDALGYQVL